MTLFLIGVVLLAALWITFQLGRVKGQEDSLPKMAEVGEEAFRMGFRACEVAQEAAQDLGTSDHVRAQRELGRNRQQ